MKRIYIEQWKALQDFLSNNAHDALNLVEREAINLFAMLRKVGAEVKLELGSIPKLCVTIDNKEHKIMCLINGFNFNKSYGLTPWQVYVQLMKLTEVTE